MSDLSVLIPTHGRAPLLKRTLTTLAECHLPEGYRETVVVENGSRDGAETIVEGLARKHAALGLRYLHVERANKSHALNLALKTMGDCLVVFFDDDIRIEPGALDAYALAAAVGPGSFFGGPFGVDYDEPPPDWLLSALPFSVRGVDFNSGDRPDEYLGFNWAAFSADIRAAGGFDPNYGPGSPTGSSGQESQMQYQLSAHGTRAVDVPGAFVWHYVPAERCSPEYAAWWMHRRGVAKSQLLLSKGGSWLSLFLRSIMGGVRCHIAWANQTLRRDAIGQSRARFAMSYQRGLLRGAIRGLRR